MEGRAIYIDAPESEVLQACQEMGVCGYLVESVHRRILLASKSDTEAISKRFVSFTAIRLRKVRFNKLPNSIVKLQRKNPTASKGTIDFFDGKTLVRGWVRPDLAVGQEIRLFRNGHLVAETQTDIFRPDLFEAGIGDGIAGFSCRLSGSEAIRGDLTACNLAGDVLATWRDPDTRDKPVSAPPVAAPSSGPAAKKAASKRSSVGTKLENGALPDPHTSGHYCVDLDTFALDYYIAKGTTNRLIVFSPGFLDAIRFPYPYFQRMKWAKSLEDTCIFLTDPTLLLGKTQIGWFIGDKTTHYLPIVARYIEKTANAQGVRPSDILFFGSSAGGFSSIGMAAHLRGARAFAVNPQTNALRLHSPAQLSNTLSSCLGTGSVIRAHQDYKERLVLTDMFRHLDYVPRISIWQNFYDRYHVENHLLPFLADMKGLSPTEDLDVHLGALPEEDHNPPDLPYIKHLFWPQ